MSQQSTRNTIRAVLLFVWRHWQQQRSCLWIIAAAMAMATGADMLMPIVSARIVDAIASPHLQRSTALAQARTAVFCMLGLGLTLITGRYVAFAATSRLTSRNMARIASDAFWRVQRLSTEWQANTFAGSTVRRITRGMWAIDLMNDTLLLALLPSLLVLAGSSVLFGLRWPAMGLWVGGFALLYCAVSITLSVNYVAPAAQLSNAQDTRIGAALADAITCNSVVKAFGAEEREEARIARVFNKWERRTYRSWIFSTRGGQGQAIVLLALRVSVAAASIYLWSQGRASAGDVTFVLTCYFLVHGYLRDVGQHVTNMQRSINEMEELVTLEGEPLGVADRLHAPALHIRHGDIRFEQVTFGYASQSSLLFDQLSLQISAGERIGLVGHSGSGKSTFVKLLHRLYELDGGRILIDGQDIAAVRQASLRSQIALVPQEPILFHRSLAENIAYGRPGASQLEIEEAAALANAHDFIVAQPKAYRTLVGERGVKLSGGERQRVALARAFLANAPVLVLDEATSSLDSDSEALIQQAMDRLMVGRTSVVIAHRLSTVRMLDRILVFHRGRIVEEGTHDRLVRQSGLYNSLFEKQVLGLQLQ